MAKINEWITEVLGMDSALQQRIFTSLLIVFLLALFRYLLLRVVWKRTEDVQVRYHWQKTTIYLAFTLGLILVGRIWFLGIHSLATFLGLAAAGVAIALQDLVKSLAGWVFVLWRRPFAVGDRIQVGSYSGDVIDIRIFKFTLMEIGNWVDADQSTGRVIHLPNSLVLTDAIANYSKGFEFIWNEIPVLVTFESDWEKAKALLLKIAQGHGAHLSGEAERRVKEASKRYMIFFHKLTPTVYTSVQDSGVLLTIRYLIEPRNRRGSAQAIWEEILRAFARCDEIDLAYPTQRFYDNAREGKRGSRPAADPPG